MIKIEKLLIPKSLKLATLCSGLLSNYVDASELKRKGTDWIENGK